MRVLWLAMLVCSLFGSTTVAAQSTESTALAPRDAAFDDMLRQALSAYESGDLVRARTLLEQVHAEEPSARTLRGLGVLAYRQQRFVEAVVLLEQSYVSPVKPLTPSMAEGVTELLADARAHVGRLELGISPKDAVLRVDDGEPVRDASGALLLNPGRHTVTASAPNVSPAVLTVVSRADTTQRLELVLRPVMPANPAEGAQAAETSRDAPSPVVTGSELAPSAALTAGGRSTRALRRRVWARALAGTAGIALITSAVAFGLWSARVGDIEEQCRSQSDGKCSTAQASAAWRREHIKPLSALAVGGAALAGASGMAGVSLWFSARAPRAVEPSRPLQIGLNLRIAF